MNPTSFSVLLLPHQPKPLQDHCELLTGDGLRGDDILAADNIAAHFHAQRVAVGADAAQRVMVVLDRAAAMPCRVRVANRLPV